MPYDYLYGKLLRDNDSLLSKRGVLPLAFSQKKILPI